MGEATELNEGNGTPSNAEMTVPVASAELHPFFSGFAGLA